MSLSVGNNVSAIIEFTGITLTAPPTGKRKQYDKEGEELKWGRTE